MNNAIRPRTFNTNLDKLWSNLSIQRGKTFGFMIIGALLAFEVFNFSTTEFALHDVLGDLKFVGIGWATILSIAFCGIDFAGIARIFTPEQGADEPAEVWYLFGAWLLAAAMNATLTWWGVSVAIANHTSQGTAVVRSETIQTVVPIFVAIMVWVIRVLIIGTFSIAGERMFTQTEARPRRAYPQPQAQTTSLQSNGRPMRPAVNTAPQTNSRPILTTAANLHAQAKPVQQQSYRRPEPTTYARQEPTYQNLMSSHQPAEPRYEELG
jgi:hypothetical protein